MLKSLTVLLVVFCQVLKYLLNVAINALLLEENSFLQVVDCFLDRGTLDVFQVESIAFVADDVSCH